MNHINFPDYFESKKEYNIFCKNNRNEKALNKLWSAILIDVKYIELHKPFKSHTYCTMLCSLLLLLLDCK